MSEERALSFPADWLLPGVGIEVGRMEMVDIHIAGRETEKEMLAPAWDVVNILTKAEGAGEWFIIWSLQRCGTR